MIKPLTFIFLIEIIFLLISIIKSMGCNVMFKIKNIFLIKSMAGDITYVMFKIKNTFLIKSMA